MANSYLKPKLRGRSENFVSVRGRQNARSPSATAFDQLGGQSGSVFERADAEFPARKSREIAENFRDTILRDSGMRDLWWEEGFVEKVAR
jgi:hypothetical protein